jgi:hypothetical protein
MQHILILAASSVIGKMERAIVVIHQIVLFSDSYGGLTWLA